MGVGGGEGKRNCLKLQLLPGEREGGESNYCYAEQ